MKAMDTARRVLGTLLVVGGATFVCGGFWFARSDLSRAVLGRYSIKWFVGALLINLGVIAVACLALRWIWRGPGDQRRSGTSTGRRFAFSCVVAALALGATEATLTVVGYPSVPRFAQPLATEGAYHAFLQEVDRVERNGAFRRAYRGLVYDPDKTVRHRIVCLGGSTTWGYGLRRDMTWPAMLEESLRSRGFDVEVINAGRDWYTTAHSLVNYTTQMRYYNPDVVIIMHGVNDLARSFPRPGEAPFERDYGSYFGPMRRVLDQYNGRSDDTRLALSSWIERSALYRLVCGTTAIDKMFYGTLRTAPKDVERSIDVDVESLPSLAVFSQNLEYLVELCETDGVRTIVATQAHAYDRPDLAGRTGVAEVMRKTFMKTPSGVPISPASVRLAMEEIRRRTIAVAEEHGVPLVDVQRAIHGEPKLFMDDVHLLGKGNALVAEAFVETVAGVLDQRDASEAVAASRGPSE